MPVCTKGAGLGYRYLHDTGGCLGKADRLGPKQRASALRRRWANTPIHLADRAVTQTSRYPFDSMRMAVRFAGEKGRYEASIDKGRMGAHHQPLSLIYSARGWQPVSVW